MTDQQNVEVPAVEYRQGIYYLTLDGKTPRERGYQHGAAWNSLSRKRWANSSAG